MNLSRLFTLVAAGESLTLELKKSTAEKDRASPTLCALANGVGGHEGLHATNRWETLPALGCGVDSLDSREIVVTLEEAIRRGRVEDPGTRDPLGVLRGLGLLVQEAGVQPPTVAVQGDCVMLTFRLAQSLVQLSAKSLADQLGISSRAVEKQIDLLKKSGRLQRIGPAKGGYWKALLNE